MNSRRAMLAVRIAGALLAVAIVSAPAPARNPIIANQGVNDPHIHIFGETAYLYASHDKSPYSKSFVMEDWQVWKSKDLVHWELASTLLPAQTYIGPNFTSAWATDVAEKNGKYYWYFSQGAEQTGVVVGDTPAGPWRDPLGKPLLAADLTPTHEYDPGILSVGDDRYIVFGVFDYYIAKLADDMTSLAEAPRKIDIVGARGPYSDVTTGPFAGKNTDDKAFLHERGGKYYLSWGAFYAIGDTPYGPYTYAGTILEQDSFAPGYDKPTWPHGFRQGRHGSFFTWHGQWYYAYCDISKSANRYFRDSFISYVHYRDDGTIAPIRVDGVGVGEYDAAAGPIEAEDFFLTRGMTVREQRGASGGFAALSEEVESVLRYPSIHGLAGTSALELAGESSAPVTLSVRRVGATAPIVQMTVRLRLGTPTRIALGALGDTESLEIHIANPGRATIAFDTLRFR